MLVSADAAGIPGDDASGSLSISGDGAFVAFASDAGNLVAGDTNGVDDIFLKDVASGAITRVSTSSSGAEANGGSGTSTTSGDGRYVAFWSEADNLVDGDSNQTSDVYMKDMQTGATSLVSADTAGASGNSASDRSSISDDGQYVAFRSQATNLVPGGTNGVLDIFVRDTVAGVTAIASADSSGNPGNADSCDTYPPSISADGRYVAFESAATNLVPGDTNGVRDIFVKDMETGEVRLASTAAEGSQGDGSSLYASIADDGSLVLFRSIAGNLVPGSPGECDGINCSSIYLKELTTGAITRVSTDIDGNVANNGSWDPALSGDGRYAAFSSDASNLVPGDTNGLYDIFVKDVNSGAIFLVSRDSAGQPGNGWSLSPYLSADGFRVVFQSEAENLVATDGNGVPDVFLARGDA
jgi:hypothetical protein